MGIFTLGSFLSWTPHFTISLFFGDKIGYSRKYPPYTSAPPPPPPPWTTLNWVPKNFRISKKDNSSFCRIANPADSKPQIISEFCKTWKGFVEFRFKLVKIWRTLMDFQSGSLSIHYRISNVVWGGGVFSGTPTL